ncbi:MAG: transcriptional repressor [Oligoflexia bacterium]|nr:transcriptional repressor [Oligoflexia bacterium]
MKKPKKLDAITTLLKGASLKSTTARQEVLKVLQGSGESLSAQQVHTLLPKDLCDRVTVYRCLETLEEAKIIQRCEFSDGIARFEFSHSEEHHHHHLVCVRCHRIESLELQSCPMKTIEQRAQKQGFSVLRHTLELVGVCASCQAA